MGHNESCTNKMLISKLMMQNFFLTNGKNRIIQQGATIENIALSQFAVYQQSCANPIRCERLEKVVFSLFYLTITYCSSSYILTEALEVLFPCKRVALQVATLTTQQQYRRIIISIHSHMYTCSSILVYVLQPLKQQARVNFSLSPKSMIVYFLSFVPLLAPGEDYGL